MTLMKKGWFEHDAVAEQAKKREANDHSSSVSAEVNGSGVMLDAKGKAIAAHITNTCPCGNKILKQASELCSTCSIVSQQALKVSEQIKSHKETCDCVQCKWVREGRKQGHWRREIKAFDVDAKLGRGPGVPSSPPSFDGEAATDPATSGRETGEDGQGDPDRKDKTTNAVTLTGKIFPIYVSSNEVKEMDTKRQERLSG